ncbi:MAG: tyrosine-type recombinase/integrase [Planctomycetota bacterium]
MGKGRAKPIKKRLSREVIKRLKPPTDADRYYVYDSKQNGLGVAVTKAGGKTFYLYRKIARRPERIRLGRWPEINCQQARDMAAEIIGQVATGHNPVEQRRIAKLSPTLKQAFEEFLQLPTRSRSKRPKSAETIRSYRNQFAYWEDWENRRIVHINARDVEVRHAELATRLKPGPANLSLALIKAVMNTAVDLGYIESHDLRRVRPFETESRERFLTAEELPRFFEAVRDHPDETFRDFVLLTLYTGQRRGNVQSMKWEDLDLTRGVWNIAKTKTGRHAVPLVGPAIEILQRRKSGNGDSEFVLPAPKGGHLKTVSAPWKAICEQAEITDLRLHDLRRSLASWQTIGGSSLQIVGKTLGHARPETTAIYGRLSDEPVRQSMNAAVKAMMEAGHED